MKINLVFALAAVLATASLVAAPDAKEPAKDAAKGEAAAEQTGPTPAQLKARKMKKPSYTKYTEAKAMAEKCGQPMIVAIFPDGNPTVQFLKQKVMSRKEFLKDFALKNCVLLYFKVKIDSKDPKHIETKQMKDSEVKFLENYAVSDRLVQQAKQANKPEPTYKDASCYPAVICVDSSCQKELFRLGHYDREGGFGVWLSTVVDSFKSAGVEDLNLSPIVNKIIENPDDPKKWR